MERHLANHVRVGLDVQDAQRRTNETLGYPLGYSPGLEQYPSVYSRASTAREALSFSLEHKYPLIWRDYSSFERSEWGRWHFFGSNAPTQAVGLEISVAR
jgi:hypothetical protein